MNPLPTLDTTRCVVYRRVSSAEQERASGPERQRKACERYGSANGLVVVGDVFEDRSGRLPMADRPGLSGALAACLEHGAGVLLVEERTRLARDEFAAHDALRTFAHAGITVLYADGSNSHGASDPAAMLLDGIGHAVAVDGPEGDRCSNGRWAGGQGTAGSSFSWSRSKLPHGYRRSRPGGVEVDPEAAAEVRRAFELVRSGASVRAAASELGWHPTMLARMIKRPAYKLAGNWRIVDPRIWNGAQEALRKRRKRR